MLDSTRIAILGAGTLGRALGNGLIQAGRVTAEQVTGTTKGAPGGSRAEAEFEVHRDNPAAAAKADLLLLCVKPHLVAEVVAELRDAGALDHAPLIVSVAAGVTTASIEASAPAGARVVRAMPNTPCLIGAGMTVLSSGSAATPEDMALAHAVFEPLGRVLELDQTHMDTVTGLSGSGPAFVYVMIEALAEGGVMMGLPRQVATELASQTVRGAASMVLESGRHPAELKGDVLTPAGCTIAGLLVMEDGGIRSTLARGVQEAAKAARDLG